MTWLVGLLVQRLGLSKIGAELLTWALIFAAVFSVIWWQRHDAYRDGVAATDAKWAEASARMQRATARAINAADTIAQVREAEQREQIKDLRDAARQGDDSDVGPGVRAVLERMRAAEGR